jgi:1-acyl-sn-glycerol-3-phosphate acyltransferase
MPPFLLSCIAIPLIYLYTIVMASLSLTLSLFDRTGELQHWCARTWCRMIAATVGMKVIVEGAENLVLTRPAVYMSNHQSYLDIPALFAFLPFQFRIMAKKPLFYVPFLGWFLWRAGHIAVDRGNRTATPKMMRDSRAKLEAGVPIVVFPEGTRNVNPRQVKEFKAGGFKLAQAANVPVVPVTIHGTSEALRPNSLLFRPRVIRLYIDSPLNVADMNLADAMTAVQRVMNERLNEAANVERERLPSPERRLSRADGRQTEGSRR